MYIYNARTTVYLNISHLLIYFKGIKDTKKKLCKNDAKRRKKFNKKRAKCFNILTEVNKLLVRLHLHKNEMDLRFLQPVECTFLHQQFMAPISWSLSWDLRLGWCRGAFFLGEGSWYCLFYYFSIIMICVCFLSTVILIIDLYNCCCYYCF